jgi:hypothetical protein
MKVFRVTLVTFFLPDVLQDEMVYDETVTINYAIEVEKYVRQAIKTNIRRWRSKRHRSATSFHPDASSIMNDILPTLENWSKFGATSGSDNDSNVR